MVLTPSRRRVRRRSALGALLVGIGSLLAASGLGPLGTAAGALQNANAGFVMQSVPENQSASYPVTSIIPDGCDSKTEVLQGLAFAIDPDGPTGAQLPGATSPSLEAIGDIPPAPASIIMTWTGWNDACRADISLSVKKADAAIFQPTVRQELLSFVACSGQGAGCTVGAASFRLELPMPTLATACFYQVDAVVGPPLDIVGPGGSFYSAFWRTPGMNQGGETTLISANNGRRDCTPVVTTTTTTPGGGGGTSSTTTSTSTTTSSTTSTTEAPTTTTTILATTVTQPTSTTGPEVLGVTVTRPPSSTSLPRTGSDAPGPGAVAGGLVVAGIGLILLGADRRLDLLRRRS